MVPKTLKNVLIHGVLVYGFFTIYGAAQTEGNVLLSRNLMNVSVKGDTLHQILSELAISYEIPIGFENIVGENAPCKLEKELKLQFDEITVKDLITSIMKATSNCDWQTVDNVINVFAKAGKSDLSESMIHSIEIPKGLSKQGIKEIIIESPEVKSILIKHGLRLGTFFTSLSEAKPVSENFSMSARDVSLRYVLNQIAKNSRSKYWNLNNWENNKETIFLNF